VIRRVLLLVSSIIWLVGLQPSPTSAQAISCANFDSWVWAQSEYEQASPVQRTALDPDNNGIACDALKPIEGFAPALWTSQIPAAAYPVQLVSVTDGDTIDVVVNGVQENVRLYRADAPEYNPPECGAQEATNALNELLGYNEAGATVYIEHDQTVRDQYGRLLAYLWLVIDGRPYLVNEALVRSGWAADKDYGDRLYAAQMGEAAEFAKRNGVGAYRICGPFGPDTGVPTPVPQPTQQGGQQPETPGGQDCESSYPSFCLPPAWVIGDQDCGDLPRWGIYDTDFTVYPPDSHGFDGNHDGEGCEGAR
jgi:micrococcal nuclease